MLSEEQITTLAAAVDRIVPPDEYPGGWEVGVGDYLIPQLTHGDLRSFLTLYQQGLDALDGESLARHGVRFSTLTSENQDALLADFETGHVSGDLPDSRQFFLLLVLNTMEGFYADPGNGGNRNGVAWDMIGFEVRG